MKDKLAGAGLALMALSTTVMDSEDLTIPFAIASIAFALLGIAGFLEWKEEHNERIIRRNIAGHKEKEILR